MGDSDGAKGDRKKGNSKEKGKRQNKKYKI